MSNPASAITPIVLNLLGATSALTGVLLAAWLWPERTDYNATAAAPALMVLGLFVVGSVVCWTGAAIVRALDR